MDAVLPDFLTLTAADLMSRDLILIPREMSLRHAARLLLTAGVTGAPVIDAAGRCAGIVSATDFMRRAGHDDALRMPPCPEPSGYTAEWNLVDLERIPEERVEALMTTDLVSCATGTPITTVARIMRNAHIHRIVVVDDDLFPVGMVTSTDILAAVARLGEEP